MKPRPCLDGFKPLDFYTLSLQSIGQKLGDDFHGRVQQRNGPEIINSFRIFSLGDKCDIRIVDTLEVSCARKEIPSYFVNIISNNMPSLFKEETVKPIRARSFVIWGTENDGIYFMFAEREAKIIQARQWLKQ